MHGGADDERISPAVVESTAGSEPVADAIAIILILEQRTEDDFTILLLKTRIRHRRNAEVLKNRNPRNEIAVIFAMERGFYVDKGDIGLQQMAHTRANTIQTALVGRVTPREASPAIKKKEFIAPEGFRDGILLAEHAVLILLVKSQRTVIDAALHEPAIDTEAQLVAVFSVQGLCK